MCCRYNFCLLLAAVLVVVVGVLIGGIQIWLREKNYVFTAVKVAALTTDALESATGRGGAPCPRACVRSSL